jgi:hypothetical protein
VLILSILQLRLETTYVFNLKGVIVSVKPCLLNTGCLVFIDKSLWHTIVFLKNVLYRYSPIE